MTGTTPRTYTVTLNFTDNTSADLQVKSKDVKKIVDKFNGYVHISGTNCIINAEIIKEIVIHK